MHERESKSLFSRGLPHILSNEQGERGKFTIFYPFLLKERRLHTHEAECTRSRCAFWFQVSDPGTIQGDLSRWSSSTNKVNNFKLCAFPHFSRQINLNRQSYRIELILIPLFFVVSPRLKKHPNFVVDLFVVENLANLEIIPRKLLVNHAKNFKLCARHFSRQTNQNLIYFSSNLIYFLVPRWKNTHDSFIAENLANLEIISRKFLVNQAKNFKLCVPIFLGKSIWIDTILYTSLRIELILISLFLVVSLLLKKHPNFVVDLFVERKI